MYASIVNLEEMILSSSLWYRTIGSTATAHNNGAIKLRRRVVERRCLGIWNVIDKSEK